MYLRTVRLIPDLLYDSSAIDSPPGPLSENFKEGEHCHIRVYRYESPLFRNAREVSLRMRRVWV